MPERALSDWRRSFVTEDKLISLVLAVLTSFIGLRTASIPTIAEGLNGWADAILAMFYVSTGWLAICLIRAPFGLLADERKTGRWHGNRYTFFEPRMMGSFRVRPTGSPEFFKLDTSFTEPNAFLYFRIDTDRPIPTYLFSASVVSDFLLSHVFAPGHGCSQGGTRLNSKSNANLVVVMAPEAVARSFTVYCTDFVLGEPDDRDGAVGNNNPHWIFERFPRQNSDPE